MSRLLFFLSLLMLFSCEKEIHFPGNYQGDVLVLNAKVLSNHIEVNLSHTADITQEVYFDSLWVNDGSIQLFKDNTQLGEFINLGKGKYEITAIQLADNTDYYLKASAPGFADVQSNTFSLLPAPDGVAVEAEQIENHTGNEDTDLVLVTVDFEDTDAGENYYLCRIWGIDNGQIYPNFLTGYFGDLQDVCNIDQFIYDRSLVVVFSDKCFNQDVFSIQIGTEIEGLYYDESLSMNEYLYYDTLIVDFGLIDKSFYDFIKTQEQPEGLEAGLVEPYYNYSSIQGGYGQVFTSNIKSWEVVW